MTQTPFIGVRERMMMRTTYTLRSGVKCVIITTTPIPLRPPPNNHMASRLDFHHPHTPVIPLQLLLVYDSFPLHRPSLTRKVAH